MNKKYVNKKLQFRITSPAKVRFTVEFPNREDMSIMNFDQTGDEEIPQEAVPTYLEAAAKHFKDRLWSGGRPTSEGKAIPNTYDKDALVVNVTKWAVMDNNLGGRNMVVCRNTKDASLFIRDWNNWDVEKTKHGGVNYGRPPKIEEIHRINQLDNWDRAKENPSIGHLFGAWEDKAVLIVGSGPSLLHAKQFIPANHPDLIVIAINGAVQFLDENQIDYVFACDRICKPEWVEGKEGKLPIVASLICPDDYLSKFSDVYLYRSRPGKNVDDSFIQEFVEDLNMLDHGKTATYSAFHLAHLGGAKAIGFIGQDFSCTSELYSAVEPMEWEKYEEMGFKAVEGIGGKPVLTCKRLEQNMSLIKGQAAFLGEGETHVINGSGRGILDLESPPNSTMAGDFNLNLPPKEAIQQCLTLTGTRIGSQECVSIPLEQEQQASQAQEVKSGS